LAKIYKNLRGMYNRHTSFKSKVHLKSAIMCEPS